MIHSLSLDPIAHFFSALQIGSRRTAFSVLCGVVGYYVDLVLTFTIINSLDVSALLPCSDTR